MDGWCLRQGSRAAPRPSHSHRSSISERHLHHPSRLSFCRGDEDDVSRRERGVWGVCWTAEDSPKGACLFFFNTLTTNTDVQRRGPRDGAWPASQEAHHRLPENHHHPTSCVAAFAPKLRRQALFFYFDCFRLLIFGKCTTLFVRWPNCKCPKNWYCYLSQCFFLLYVHKDRKTV